jgi:hypothetical protein
VIAWGGLTNRPWTVLVGAALAAHVNSAGWLVVLGVVRLALQRTHAADSRAGSREPTPHQSSGIT